MKLVVHGDELICGLSPKADFLPDSLRVRRVRENLERSMLSAVIVTVVICFFAYIASTVISFGSNLAITITRENFNEVLAKQAQYKDLMILQATSKRLESARLVVTAQEILWKPFNDELLATFSPGASIESLEISSLSASGKDSVREAELQSSNVATIQASIAFPGLPGLEIWLRNLTSLTGYADSTLNSVKASKDSYVADVTIHLNRDVFAKRYYPENLAKLPTPTPTATIMTTSPSPTPTSSGQGGTN